MRTISSQEERLLTHRNGRTQATRVRIANAEGDLVDVCTYVRGIDMLVMAKWRENVDGNGYVATVDLHRQHAGFSLNPLMEDSPINRDFDPTNDYAPLIAQGRRIVIEWQLLPIDGKPSESAWKEGFRGFIDEFELATTPITIECADQMAKAAKTFIRRERAYNYAQPGGAVTPDRGCFIFDDQERDWEAGDLLIPSQDKLNGHFYVCTEPGTTVGADEPDEWPTGAEEEVEVGTATFEEAGPTSAEDGTALETALQQLLDDNMGDFAPTLYVPTSPGWMIRWWVQQRESLWSAMRALVDQIGWDLRWKWDDGTSAFRLTLWCPDRSKTAADRTFGEYDGPADDGVKSLKSRLSDIRNVVHVVYSDADDLDPQGNPKRKVYEARDEDSIAALASDDDDGEVFMEVAESSASNINTLAEATDYGDRILSDLSTPAADFSVELPFFPFAEIGDLYAFPPNDRHFSSEQKFAVVSVDHSIDSSGRGTTTLQTRGKVSAGHKRWLNKDVRVVPAEVHAQVLVTSDPTVPEAIPIPGGVRFTKTIEQVPTRPNMRTELHLGDAIDFTPDASTLKSITEARDMVLPDQVPGKTQYAKTVPFWFNASKLVRGLPSKAIQVTHGRSFAGHLKSEVQWGRLPLNGGFETQFDPAAPPDFWSVPASHGTWGTELKLVSDAGGFSGSKYVKFDNVSGGGTTTYQLKTATFDVMAGQTYFFSMWAKFTGGTGILELSTAEHDWDLGSNRVASIAQLDTSLHPSGVWLLIGGTLTVNSATRFMELTLSTNVAASGFTAYVDAVSAVWIGEGWRAVGAANQPSFDNAWGNTTGEHALVFRRDNAGNVVMRGYPSSSADLPNNGDESDDGNLVFTLPAIYAPPSPVRFITSSKGLPAHIVILANGKVLVTMGEKDGVSFDCVRYPTG